MKHLITKSTLAYLIGLVSTQALAQTDVEQLNNGWMGLTRQTDPFDSSSVEVFQIMKSDFTFRCNELNVSVDSYGYESLSFDAELTYKVDDHTAQSKKGRYSTYLGGSDLVTDSRYYSFKMSDEDVAALIRGNTIQVAGKYGNTGWQTKSLNLTGFSSLYSEMCK